MSSDLDAQRRLIVALDVPDVDRAFVLWQELNLPQAVCKVGLELLYSGGVDLVKTLVAKGARVFVDAKLLDIGNTVERATARIADLGASFVTVHAQDRKTVEAAAKGRGASPMKLLGITVLTNMTAETLAEQGVAETVQETAMRRAAFAADLGFDGVVSSPLEAQPLKAMFGNRLLVVCPGVRPKSPDGIARDDQARVATPREALLAGADYLVVGRPILGAKDPTAAARGVVEEMADALRQRETSPFPAGA
jgi:orotidine-5'-phosphate decarboxylase